MGQRPILVRCSNGNHTERGNGLKIDVLYRTRYRLNSSLSKHASEIQFTDFPLKDSFKLLDGI